MNIGNFIRSRFFFILILGFANLALLAPWTRPVGAIFLALILPGWGWASYFVLKNNLVSPFTISSFEKAVGEGETAQGLNKLILALGFSFALTSLAALVLHYLPGPIYTWHILLTLNLVTLLPTLVTVPSLPRFPIAPTPYTISFFTILLIAGLFRFANLNYSEFQGDEALAMIVAAEALEGHEDALFLRGKGPGEVLLPLVLWRLNGLVNEGIARIPFATAGIAGILTLYLIAEYLFSKKVALCSATFFAASGFMLGFSRIVQYQSIVIWMSALTLWTLWQWWRSGRQRWSFASGVFAGIGLLAHYDAILILPAVGWLFLSLWFKQSTSAQLVGRLRQLSLSLGLWLIAFFVTTLPFYLPYFRDPQFQGTSSYLGDRIGDGWLKNNVFDFLHFNTFYSSFFYVLITGLLLIGFFGWALWRTIWGRYWGIGVMLIISSLMVWPNLLGVWTGIPLSLICLLAFVSSSLNLPQRLAFLWFAVPFLGYNFGVAQPLTHIYTIIPGWSLLAGWTIGQWRFNRTALVCLNLMLFALFSGYLWLAFLRTEISFVQTYPANSSSFYWTPYDRPPKTGFFGFPHQTGWKAVGTLIAEGVLIGDYNSNEEEDISSWYTRHTPRACDSQAEFYFIATDLIDQIPVSDDLLVTYYAPIGETTLVNDNRMTIHQLQPTLLALPSLDHFSLARQFDATASPAAFTRTARWDVEADTNFGNQIRLRGYDLNARRAYPGGRLHLILYWELVVPVQESYKVFVQFDAVRKFAQADSFPACSRYPTNLWRPRQIIADPHTLLLSPDTPLETIALEVGLYLPEDGRRLDILDIAGNPSGVSLRLTEVQVQ